MPKSEPFYRFECDKCGAPLKKTEDEDVYKCEHCGAVFLRSSTTRSSVNRKAPTHEAPKPKAQSGGIVPPKIPPSSKKQNSLIILILGITGVVLCVLVFFVFGVFSSQPKFNLGLALEEENKPEMLISLPESLPAGNALYYKDWEIVVDVNVEVETDILFIKVLIRNWQEESRIFRYIPNQLEVYDDLGNKYEISNVCNSGEPFLIHQIVVDSGKTIQLNSRKNTCQFEDYLPAFHGVIPVEAKHLFLRMKEFGVVEEIYWVFDL